MEATSLSCCAIRTCQRCHRQWSHAAAWEQGPTDTQSHRAPSPSWPTWASRMLELPPIHGSHWV